MGCEEERASALAPPELPPFAPPKSTLGRRRKREHAGSRGHPPPFLSLRPPGCHSAHLGFGVPESQDQAGFTGTSRGALRGLLRNIRGISPRSPVIMCDGSVGSRPRTRAIDIFFMALLYGIPLMNYLCWGQARVYRVLRYA